MEFIAVSRVAIELDAADVLVIDAEAIPKLLVLIDVILTEIV
jgi:hypothetical protein